MKLKKIKPENYRYLLFAGAIALSLTCGIAIQKDDGSIKVSDSILKMNVDNGTITYETASFNNLENVIHETGLVIEEKLAIDPIYIFSSENELKYNTQNISIKIEPKDDCAEFANLEKGTETTILGYNEYGYAKIMYENQEMYIKNENLVSNIDEVFYNCSYIRYTTSDVNIYDSIYGEKILGNIKKHESVNVIGENDSAYCLVNNGNITGYVLKESLATAYIKQGNDGVTDYYKNNMYDGILSTVDPSQQTEENVELLARLIHCEAGGQTEEGKLAVATVVVNRAYDGNMGNTIRSVIERPSQFSPVSNGKINRVTPTQSDYNAARKVLIEGYRSFPAYVLYFQSIGNGYFRGQKTYCVCYNANKSHPQYFSYSQADLNKYKY